MPHAEQRAPALVRASGAVTIPPVLHFCWIGRTLPWAYAFALLSAAARSQLAEVVLHHTDALAEDDAVRALRAAPGIRLSRLDPATLLLEAGDRLGLADRLALLHARLDDPVQRSDVLRLAILYTSGGIYADLDTVTVASLRPLLDAEAFVGTEPIVWTQAARASRSPRTVARAVGLDLGRKLCRTLPHGWIPWRRVERLYGLSVNNAVMGAAAGAALMADCLRATVELAPARQRARYGLGPHLLAGVVGDRERPDVTVHEPRLFYPLPPEISEHWFRRVRRPELRSVLGAETRIVHWYASVRTRARVALIDPAYIGRHRTDQLYSSLVWSCVPGVARMA